MTHATSHISMPPEPLARESRVGDVYTEHGDGQWADEVLPDLLRGGAVPDVLPLTVLGTDYKLSWSILVRPTHPWQWPVHTSTGWCFGRIGFHVKGSQKVLFQ